MTQSQPADPNHDAVELLRMVAPERYEWVQELLKKYVANFCAGKDKVEFVLRANPLGFI